MGSLSGQTLALFLVLSPGFLFLAGFHLTEPQYPTRQDIQRGVIVETALFVVMSSILHSTIGMSLLLGAGYFYSCDIFSSLFEFVTTQVHLSANDRCSIKTDLASIVAYSATLSVSAYILGKMTSRWLARTPDKFAAIYGSHYETFKGRQAYVIANVMTNVTHDGKVLMYEGQLVELSVSSAKMINYVCIEGASRFYMSVKSSASSTTPRHQFQSIDKNSGRKSRLIIQGDKIVNLVTRTYPVEIANLAESGIDDIDDPITDTRRHFVLFHWMKGWFK